MDTVLTLSIAAPIGIYALGVTVPGPNLLLIAQASFKDGHRNGAAAALGTTASVAVYAIATVIGVSVLVASLPWMLFAIQLFGGAYLSVLGFVLLRQALAVQRLPVVAASAPGQPANRALRAFLRGLFVGLGNPKMAIFFLGLFAPTLAEDTPMIARVIVLIGIVATDLAYHQALALMFAKSRSRVRIFGRRINALLAGSMMAFGVVMIGNALRRT